MNKADANVKPVILGVDDDENNLIILKRPFAKVGYSLLTANSGVEALLALSENKVDVILLDWMMPKMSGLETLEKIRKHDQWRLIPVIMVTAKSSPEDIKAGLQAGAIDYITKPYDRIELIARVGAALREKELITRLSEANIELRIAKDQAVDATKLKDQFVSLVAHDLRAPFNSIVGLLQVINEDETDPLSARHRELMDHVLDSANNQLHMIEKLLNISRLQTGKIVLNKTFTDIAYSIGLIIENIGYLAEKKGIFIQNSILESQRIYADFDLYNEVLHNILSNAIKFCKDGDTISIFIPEGRPTTIAVQDNGDGISDDILPHLFKHEVRTTTIGAGGEKGTGLGLPYSHDIVVAHGGSIVVESTQGEGSIFYIELPDVRPRVLIIDEDTQTRKAIVNNLSRLDVEITESAGAAAAFELISDNAPDLIVAEITLPGLNGQSFIQSVREHLGTKTPPIIATADANGAFTKQDALKIGANDLFTKPVITDEFASRLLLHLM